MNELPVQDPAPSIFEVRDAALGHGWKRIEQITVDDLGVPRTRVLAVLSPADFAALRRALAKDHAREIAANQPPPGETCGARPSKDSTARCESPPHPVSQPHSGRTAGGQWKHWYDKPGQA